MVTLICWTEVAAARFFGKPVDYIEDFSMSWVFWVIAGIAVLLGIGWFTLPNCNCGT